MRASLMCPTTVGRQEFLSALLERLDRAIAGEGQVLLIGGDAGVGKSRLVRDLKHEASKRPIRIIEGRCSSTESSVPYAPLMDALRFRIERGEGEKAARMLGPLRALLAPLFPQLEGGTGDVQDRSVDRTSDRPFELIFGVLERLAKEEPMLLVLEDVHWADQTSLELLHHLAHRAKQLPMLLVATYRSDELHATHRLRKLLGALARDRVGEEMRLNPLTREQTAEMLRHMLGKEADAEFAAAIWNRSEGNPFFVEELVSALAESGPLEPNAAAAEALEKSRLPATVSEAVLARVHAAGPNALEVLSAVAVMGRTVEFDDLCEVLGMSEEQLVPIVENLVAHQLLREERSAEGERYSFPHALMQESLYESIISRRRRMLHRRVAAALERRTNRRIPSRPDRLAYHYRVGGDHERAHMYARMAGDEAVRLRAWDDAALHYENALASLEHSTDDGARAAELLERLAGVAWRQSRAVAGRQYAIEALRLRRELGHKEETARLLRRLAALRVEDRDHAGAAEALDEALQLLVDQPESPELGPIYADLGRLSLARGELERAESLLVHGLSLASRDAHGAEEVLALVSLAELSVVAGRVSAGVMQLDVALSILREGRLPFERLARVYAAGTRTLLLAEDYARALSWANTARALCEKQSVVGLDALFRAYRAAILTMTGSQEDTLAEAAAAVDDLRRARRAELREALRVLGFVHRARGELEAARNALQAAASEGGATSVGLALVALADGRPDEAAATLVDAMRAVPSDQPLVARKLLPYVVEALTGASRLDEAEAFVSAAKPLQEENAGAAQLLHATGLVQLARGNAAEARKSLSFAAAAYARIGNRLESARVNVSVLEATIVAGEPAEGLALGRRLLEELGRPLLPRERDFVRKVLRRAGVRTRPRTPEPVTDGQEKSVLTMREQAVLREVAQGRTNREIANALGIAEKTVSVHVSNILAKLGCRTRTQAARFVSDQH